ncbi:MAG: indolepyruvate ferredoxin oxidoreductase family protein [Deltaproteobacteria bacterium]|nr:indolepyruvate ferredoxin oxidoreductase family protein [Deltaproteobacteria bacterium]
MGAAATISLDDKFRLERGRVFLSGIQALVRLPLVQSARDEAAGLRTAGFVSGYRGSPLAGLDLQLWRAREQLAARRVHFEPGLNEELAATAVWGSQQVGLHPGARAEGVFGMWYGKAPGVDRACDALRHANAAGTSPLGGVLLVAGDDHACKSSSYPTQSEYAMMHLEIPVLAPASVQEVLDFGLWGWALSRYAGCWVSLIALTDLMDGSAVVEVSPERALARMPADFEMPRSGVHIRGHDDPKEQERRLREWKLPAAMAFARANGLDRVVFDAPVPRLAIVASGKGYSETRQALCDLGIDAGVAAAAGIRLVKVGMPWPLDPVAMRSSLAGCEKVLVVEEKRGVIEAQLKEQLYTLPDRERPRVVGKRDQSGAPLLPDTGELTAADVARAVALQLPAGVSTERVDDHMARAAVEDLCESIEATSTRRAPFFCSGCPHNRSTVVPEGSRALVGIGCHYMVQWMDRSSDQVCQMGGEGVAWLGQAPFTDEPHIFANLGDGTYTHSGILAIRAAVVAGARITYKLLYNDSVAMTGGQPLDGGFGVAEITRQLAAEGVAQIVVVSDRPEHYAGETGLAPGVRVEPRGHLDGVQRELREVQGVSVLVYDQGCAAEKRRKRKRGTLEDPPERVFINSLVCEGCGDCSAVSNCLSVEPMETAFGRKRRIDQSACNKDFSCLEGSCPSFAVIRGARPRRSSPAGLRAHLEGIPEPSPLSGEGVYNVLLAGVGGTGVTTVAALLGMAAHIEGRASAVLDMTGLAQKGGAVISHVRIADDPDQIHGSRIPQKSADLLLGFDMLVAASAPALEALHRWRTKSVVDTHVSATAAFVLDNAVRYDGEEMLGLLRRSSREIHALDSKAIAEAILGDAIGANVFLLGHAWQLGLVPLKQASIEAAIELNGVALEANRFAFALGRLAAHDPKRFEERSAPGEDREEESLAVLVDRFGRELAAYQNEAWAERYRGWVERVREIEAVRVKGSDRLARSVARCAFQLMSYKDEYEVARLYSDGRFREQLEAEFDGDYRIELQLAPPRFARRDERGRLVKGSYGAWILPLLRLLARGKVLRGTPFDVFGGSPERRLERRLIEEYAAQIDALLPDLCEGNHELACRIAELPEGVRGFDRVKLQAAEKMEREGEALLGAYRRAASGRES